MLENPRKRICFHSLTGTIGTGQYDMVFKNGCLGNSHATKVIENLKCSVCFTYYSSCPVLLILFIHALVKRLGRPPFFYVVLEPQGTVGFVKNSSALRSNYISQLMLLFLSVCHV